MAQYNLEVGVVSLEVKAGEVLGGWHFNVVDKNGVLPPVDVDSPDPKVQLDFVPGDYVAFAWRALSDGNKFGDAVTAEFTVPVPVMGDAAGTLTVTLV